MALLQTNADHAFAAQVKILKENVGELRDRVAELNTSVVTFWPNAPPPPELTTKLATEGTVK